MRSFLRLHAIYTCSIYIYITRNGGISESSENTTEPEVETEEEGVATPSASFLDEPIEENTNSSIKLDIAELGWHIYNLKEKNMRYLLHAETLNTYIDERLIPKGLTIKTTPAVDKEDKEWNERVELHVKRILTEDDGDPVGTL